MKDKKKHLITSLVVLLPILVGLLLWNELPDRMPTHFNMAGEADNWSGKAFAVFSIPLIMLVAHWVIIWAAKWDQKNWGHNEKIMNVVLWLFPVNSLVMNGFLYSTALGKEWNISRIMSVLLGVFFIGMGNYLPKCRLNATVGIKLKWTYYNEENWNKTHRFGGKCWVIAGLGMAVSGLFAVGYNWVVLVMIAMVFAPVVYSYLLYKKQVREGTWIQSESSKQMYQDVAMRKMGKWSVLALVVILGLVAVLLFTGNIDVIYYEDHFVVEASFHQDAVVYYDEITSVEYRSIEPFDGGSREWGVGSARLLLGLFRNEEFGLYTRYTYTNAKSYAIIYCGEDVLVLTGEDSDETEQIALTLSEKIG